MHIKINIVRYILNFVPKLIIKNYKNIIVGSRFVAQDQDVWDLGLMSPVQ